MAMTNVSLFYRIAFGISCVSLSVLLFISIDLLRKKANLKTLNTLLLALFIGLLLGKTLTTLFTELISFTALPQFSLSVSLIKSSLFLFSLYIALILTLDSSKELYLSIPYIRFNKTKQKSKDLLLDISCLHDSRTYDLLTSGIINQKIIIPSFIEDTLEEKLEKTDFNEREQARIALLQLKKIRDIDQLYIFNHQVNPPFNLNIATRTLKIAKSLDANILVSSLNSYADFNSSSIQLIDINYLSSILKPLKPPGDTIELKIQRSGKEPRQGVGYLDDGTMVVVNNGGDFIGQLINTQVISIKQTSSGRIVFTNAILSESVENKHFSSDPLYENIKS